MLQRRKMVYIWVFVLLLTCLLAPVAHAVSSACDVTAVVTPSPQSSSIVGTDITTFVSYNTTSLTVNASVSAGATWKLYADAGYTSEITNKIVSPSSGDNMYYMRVTAENGVNTKNYTLSMHRETEALYATVAAALPMEQPPAVGSANHGGNSLFACNAPIVSALTYGSNLYFLSADGAVFSFGAATNGELGNGSLVLPSPTMVQQVKTDASTYLSGIDRIYANAGSVGFAYDADTLKMYGWGSNAGFRIDPNGTTSDKKSYATQMNQFAAHPFSGLPQGIVIAGTFVAYIGTDGLVYSYGQMRTTSTSNADYRLGYDFGLLDARVTEVSSVPYVQWPQQVPLPLNAFETVVALGFGGGTVTYALTSEGRVFTWGKETLTAIAGATAPFVLLTNPAGVAFTQMSVAQSGSAIFLGDDNQVYSLIFNATTPTKVPVLVSGSVLPYEPLNPYVKVSCGGTAATTPSYMATRQNGEVYVWGSGANGQLANGSTSTVSVAQRNTALDNSQYAIYYLNGAMIQDTKLYVWGYHPTGGSVTPLPVADAVGVPVLVPTLMDNTKIPTQFRLTAGNYPAGTKTAIADYDIAGFFTETLGDMVLGVGGLPANYTGNITFNNENGAVFGTAQAQDGYATLDVSGVTPGQWMTVRVKSGSSDLVQLWAPAMNQHTLFYEPPTGTQLSDLTLRFVDESGVVVAVEQVEQDLVMGNMYAIIAKKVHGYQYVSSDKGLAITLDSSAQNNIVTLTYEPVSSACNVVSVTTPAGASIGSDTVSAVVSGATASLTVNLSVSAGATWALYADPGCTLEIADKNVDLALGLNIFYIQVVAEDGISTKVYELSITRGTASTACDVLSVDGATVNEGNDTVTATVPNATTTFLVNGTVSAGATWKLLDASLNEIVSKTMTLVVGDNTAYIEVTAQDGVTQKVYTVTVTRETAASSACDLLTVTGATVNEGEDTVSATVDSAETTFTVIATISENATWKLYDELAVEIPSKILPLTGDTTIGYIEVMAQDGVTNKVYTLTVTKSVELSSACDVLSVVNAIVDGGTDTVSATVPYETTTFLVNATVSADATWKLLDESLNEIVNKTMTLSVGENIGYIEVTAEDGVTTKLYTLTVTRLAQASTACDLLTVTGATVNEGNDTVSATVDSAETTFAVIATVSENATWKLYNEFAVEIPSKILPLTGDTTMGYIEVMAQDGVTNKVYALTVTKQTLSTACDLLTVTGATVNEGDDTVSATVEGTETTFTVIATVSENATWKLYDELAVEIPSKILPLTGDITTGYIEVMAQDGVTNKVYALTVTKHTDTYAILTLPYGTESGVYIVGLDEGLTVTDFTTGLTTDGGTVKIMDSAGVAQQTGATLLATGMKLWVVDESQAVRLERTLVVVGDIDGNGVVNALDLLTLKQQILKMQSLTGAFAKAADINGNGVMNSTDLLKLQRMLLGLE